MSHKSTSGDLRSKNPINAFAYICLYTYSWHWKRDNMPCIIFTLSIISFGQMCNDRQFKTLLGGLTYHLNFRALFQIALDIAVLRGSKSNFFEETKLEILFILQWQVVGKMVMAKVIFCLILLKLAASQDCGYCTSCMKRDSRQILITVELIGSESILAKVGNKIIQNVS